MSASNSNNEIRQAAEYAIKVAKDKFGQALNYSENSLPGFDKLLVQAYEQNQRQAENGRTSEDAIKRTASIWGCYLGEVMRGIWGGEWISGENSERTLLIKGMEFFPISYTYLRITGQLQNNVIKYIDEIEATLFTQLTNPVQPKPNQFNNAQASNPLKTEQETAFSRPPKIRIRTKKIFSVEKILLIVIVAVLSLAVVIAGGMFATEKLAYAKANATVQTDYYFATQTACQGNFLENMTRLLSDFFRVQSTASVPADVNLPEQVTKLENIRTEAWNIPEKSCESHFHELFMDYMDKSITVMITFAGNQNDYTWRQQYIIAIEALVKLDDFIKTRGYVNGLVGLFRNKGYYYWEILDDPSWRSSGG